MLNAIGCTLEVFLHRPAIYSFINRVELEVRKVGILVTGPRVAIDWRCLVILTALHVVGGLG